MGSTWLRHDVTMDRDPTLRKAGGFWAVVAFERVLRVVKTHGDRGEVDADTADPSFILGEACVPECHTASFKEGLDGLFETGRLVRVEGGGFSVKNWAKYQPDPRAAERKRTERKNKRHGLSREVTGQPAESRDDPEVTTTGRDGTKQDGTQRDGTPSRGDALIRVPRPNEIRQTCHLCSGWVDAGAGWLDGYDDVKDRSVVRHRPGQCQETEAAKTERIHAKLRKAGVQI